ncbi:hypothetical protein HDU89_007477 [Geranomyces variabilis]|nr:hypothetical protein HDU89_007477 [Geranomyces variabilis]
MPDKLAAHGVHYHQSTFKNASGATQTQTEARKHRDHFDRDMSNGLIIVIAKDGAICTATHGRWLDGTVPRPVSLLMKDAIYLRSLDDPEYNANDASSLGVKCEFAVYFDDGHGSHAFWTPVNGRQEAKTAQLEFE